MLKNIMLSFFILICSFKNALSEGVDDLHIFPKFLSEGLIPIYALKGEVQKKQIESFLEGKNIPGMRIVFYEKGQLVWAKDFGYANLSNQSKVNKNTVFAAASVSKPLAAVAALKQVEDGLLNLNDDVNKKLKGWKIPDNEFTKQNKVSLRHLISHTSGFSRYFYSIYNSNESIPTIEQMLTGSEPSKDMPASMIYVPGNGYKYSNTGYLIIEKLVEDVSGSSFEKVLNQSVLIPSKMTASSFKQPMPLSMLKHMATGYSENSQPYPYVPLPFKALGGLWTTPDDLAKFISTLLKDYHTNSHKILSQKMAEQVFNRGENKLGFSLWNWKDDIVFRHTGHNPGFTSFVFGSVNKQQVLVVMTNGENTQDLFDYLQRAVADAYEWDYFRSEEYKPYTGNIPNFKHYTGQYEWNGNYVNFSPEKNGLFMQINNERHLLTPVSKNEFLLKEKPLKIIFPDEMEGKINEVVIWKDNGDYTKAFRR